MQLNQLREDKPNFRWQLENYNAPDLKLYDIEDTCRVLQPHVWVNMREYASLNETTYKDIASLIDPLFLRQKVRSDVLRGLELRGFDKDIMRFLVNSSKHEENRLRYSCNVMFDQWDEIGQDPDFNFIERARMLLWVGDIRLHCTCPSFLYWGYQYILTVLDAAIYPERTQPAIRNPGERGSVCKHLHRVMKVLPFYSGEIASEMKKQFG